MAKDQMSRNAAEIEAEKASDVLARWLEQGGLDSTGMIIRAMNAIDSLLAERRLSRPKTWADQMLQKADHAKSLQDYTTEAFYRAEAKLLEETEHLDV